MVCILGVKQMRNKLTDTMEELVANEVYVIDFKDAFQ